MTHDFPLHNSTLAIFKHTRYCVVVDTGDSLSSITYGIAKVRVQLPYMLESLGVFHRFGIALL